MTDGTGATFLCVCGKVSPLDRAVANEPVSESTCGCGRKYQVEVQAGGRAVISEPITPEPRQPLASFSRELKASEDSQRFYFSHVVTRGHRLPVHILFSRSARRAEVATGDMKPLRLESVDSVIEARRRWIDWFESLRRNPGGRRSSAAATWVSESSRL
jgi:hypothetical protein